MSIRGYGLKLVNGNTGNPSDQFFGEYILKLGAKRKDGKIIMRQVEFGMCGTGSLADLDEAASIMAARIAKLSEGVMFGFFKKLGKYRNDESPANLACNQTQYGSVIVSNDPRVQNPDALGPYPLTKKSSKVFIPWLDDATSRQDMKATVIEPVTVNTGSYYLAASRFADNDKTSIEVYPMQYVQGVQTKCYNTAASFDLVNDDSSDGMSTDQILSEAESAIVSGSDDQ